MLYFAASGPINPAEVVNQLFPNLWILLAHVFATITLLILLTRWVYNPFRRAMRRRRQFIQNLITEAREKQTEAAQNQNVSRQMLVDAKTNAQKIVLNAREEAEEKKLYILQGARKEIEALNQNAKLSIAKEREASQEAIRQSIASVAFEVAETILRKEIDQKTHAELIEESIDDLN